MKRSLSSIITGTIWRSTDARRPNTVEISRITSYVTGNTIPVATHAQDRVRARNVLTRRWATMQAKSFLAAPSRGWELTTGLAETPNDPHPHDLHRFEDEGGPSHPEL